MSSHLDAGIQELIKVFAELSGCNGQLTAGTPGGMDHVPCRLVQTRGRLVQLTLGLLERLGGQGKLRGRRREETGTFDDIIFVT